MTEAKTLRIYQNKFERFEDGSARVTLVKPFPGPTKGWDSLTISFTAAEVLQIVEHLLDGKN